jgi:hypothetical protein
MTENSAADKANAGSKVWGDEDTSIVNDENKAAADAAKADSTHDENKEVQRVKTDLGRKVKDQAEQIELLKSQNAQVLEALANLKLDLTGSKTAQELPKSGDDLFDKLNSVLPCPVDPDDLLTPRMQAKYEAWRTQATQIVTQREYKGYADNYVSQMNGLRERGGTLHEEVVRLITADGSPYNKTHGTGRGDVDAKINYANALADLRSNDPEAVKWGKGQSPSKVKAGVTAKTESDTSGSKGRALIGTAADLAKHFGYSDKEVKEASERHIAAAGQRR